MGTNYYMRKNICPNCGRYDELHIGKSSIGWQFTFQGYERDELKEIGIDIPIKSFADWRKILKKEKIFDEYGREILYKDFIKLVESKRNEKFNHTISYGTEQCWLDSQGYSFQRGNFL